MSKFDDFFSDVVPFTPSGCYLSKNLFTEDEAMKMFSDFLNEDIENVEVSHVRFQPTPSDFRDEGLPAMAWCTCNSKDRNSQPCWAYGED